MVARRKLSETNSTIGLLLGLFLLLCMAFYIFYHLRKCMRIKSGRSHRKAEPHSVDIERGDESPSQTKSKTTEQIVINMAKHRVTRKIDDYSIQFSTKLSDIAVDVGVNRLGTCQSSHSMQCLNYLPPISEDERLSIVKSTESLTHLDSHSILLRENSHVFSQSTLNTVQREIDLPDEGELSLLRQVNSRDEEDAGEEDEDDISIDLTGISVSQHQ